MAVSINDLPNEILEFVFSLLPPYLDLEQCAAVCKRWTALARNVQARKKSCLQKGLTEFNLCWEENVYGVAPRIAARFGHASTLHRNSMYVFGGASLNDSTFNDLWKFDLSRREWVRPIAMGSYPTPKAGASLVCHKDTLILFGGWRHASTVFHMYTLIDDLHVYNIRENRWSIHNDPLYGPPPMTGHSATVHRNKMIMFGGYVKQQENLHTTNDIWVLDLDKLTWRKPPVSNLKPPPRYGQFQMAIGEDHILVLGGIGGVNRILNDAWLLDMQRDLWCWKRVQIKNRIPPLAQNWCYPACSFGSKVILLGPASPNDFQIIRISRFGGIRPIAAPPVQEPRNRAAGRDPPDALPGRNNIPRQPPPRANLPPPAVAANPPVNHHRSPEQPSSGLLRSPNNNIAPNNNGSNNHNGIGSVGSEPKAGPSGLRISASGSSSPQLGSALSPRPLPIIRSAFARASSDDDHLPKRFNQQAPEQNHLEMAAFGVPPPVPPRPAGNSRERHLLRLRELRAKLFKDQEPPQQPNGHINPPPDLRASRGPLKTPASDGPKAGTINGGVADKPLGQPDPVTPKRVKRSGLSIYVCDVSNILPASAGEPWIEWQEPINSGQIAGAPDRCTFSTMVSGNGELIVFGGVHKHQNPETMIASNAVHFLTVPTAVV
ncbi:F-box only protein 42 [Anopheles aquasalis]|uniref:F-box only protein 42 n=1 Tax=Anopheles aquasalis TaxID=42839 RepID=UPI00215A567F|nr:F-box only protein 42 [Anopheles aquasalis]